jgi:hypothetical protein
LPGGEALRQLSLTRVKFFGVIEEAPHVGPHQALLSLSEYAVGVKLAPWPVEAWTSSANQ